MDEGPVVQASLAEYTTLQSEKRLQQWTLRLLHLAQLALATAMVTALVLIVPGPWFSDRPTLGSSLAVAVAMATSIMIWVVNVMMVGAMFQVHVLSRKVADIESRINRLVGDSAMSWESVDVADIYYADEMGKSNFVYKADLIVFPVLGMAQILAVVVGAGYLERDHGWVPAAVVLALSAVLLLASVWAGWHLLAFVRSTPRLEDMKRHNPDTPTG